MRLILARHGETDMNKLARIQGISDLELNETGERQAEALAQALKNERVEAIYTSPLKRARDTAYIIGRYHQVAIVPLFGLRELDAGEVDGLTYKEMRAQYGDFLDKWIEDCTSISPPGGCSLHELQDNAWAAIQDIIERHNLRMADSGASGKGVVLAVTHYFPILSIICRALGLGLSECRRMRLDLASMCTLDFNSPWSVLASLNDTCHLRRKS